MVILIQTLHVVIHNICVRMIERKKLTQRQQRAELLAVQGVEVKQVSHCVDNFHTCGLEAGEAHMIPVIVMNVKFSRHCDPPEEYPPPGIPPLTLRMSLLV